MSNSNEVDFVITYVDNTDPVWQKEISQFNTEIDDKRYRNWDFLKYQLQLVEKNLEFIRKIYLVVAYESQVPEWLDRDKITVIYHRDIIPEKYLPTFNSTTIEMFLYRIPGLCEKFIYSNDDMFPMKKCDLEDFFVDNKPVYQLIHRKDKHNLFRLQCYNSHRLACECAEIKPSDNSYFYIRHSFDPMLKSSCEEVWNKVGYKIERMVTKFREPFNYTQYLFPDYDVLRGNYVDKKFDFCYCKMTSIDSVRKELMNGEHKVICLNDSNACRNFIEMKKCVLECLSKYE